MSLIFIEMLNFVKCPDDLDSDLDKWVYALKHLTEFKTKPDYLIGAEFDQLFNLAKYANLTKRERQMYNSSLKHKWDNKNVMDYAVKNAVKNARTEERAKAREEKIELARQMLGEKKPLDKIVRYTGLSIDEISAL